MSRMQVSIVTTTAKEALKLAPPSAGTTLQRSTNPLLGYIDAIGAATCKAVDMWASSVSLVDVMINGPTASGGRLVGPMVGGLVLGFAPDAPWREHTTAIAAGLDTQMAQFQLGVKVPGLPWFPSFAAFPGPVTPPMPAPPTPLLVLAGGSQALLEETPLRLAFLSNFARSKAAQGDELSAALAKGLAAAFKAWLPSTLVTQVMGWGHVPTFAPPYVPVGPVVNGRALMMPGGLV